MKFIYFGTPEFSVTVLKQILKEGLKPSLVVTTEDKPVGRKQKITSPPLKVFAKKNNIPYLQADRLTNNLKEELQADLFVVAAYGNILPQSFLDIPEKGVLNVHPSLLPKYRGPSPVHAPILNGDTETGVSIILLDEKMDHGPILSQETYNKNIDLLSTEELTNVLALLGGKLLAKTIVDWTNDDITPIEQDDKEATFTKMIQKKDGLIDFNNSAEYIERQIRAYKDWPGAYYFIKDKEDRLLRLKIIKAHLIDKKTQKKGIFYIKAKDGLLLVDEVQLEGKKVISGEDFMRGYSDLLK